MSHIGLLIVGTDFLYDLRPLEKRQRVWLETGV